VSEVMTLTRDEKIEGYIHLCATQACILALFPKPVRDEIETDWDLDSLTFMKEADHLFSELWARDEDVYELEYRLASERENQLVVRYLAEFGQLVKDYLLREIKEVASLPVRPSDA
jgi:hypothetical protein